MCTSYMVCLACNRAPFITQYAVYCNVVNRLLECSSQEASKALIMREYDTTNITLIRQSRKQLARIIVRLVGIENKTNLRAKQQSGKRHHYEEFVEKAVARKDRQFKALVTKRMTCFYLMCRFLEVRGT